MPQPQPDATIADTGKGVLSVRGISLRLLQDFQYRAPLAASSYLNANRRASSELSLKTSPASTM